jgi:sulfatase maturation enzyme AslB (radical SAM superfamily)
MITSPGFESLVAMENSQWLSNIKNKFSNNEWPDECVRCHQTEQLDNTSIRLNSIKTHETSTTKDYLQVGGVLDNICNSACQFCNASLSTKIGSLISLDYPKLDNFKKFCDLPQDRIEHLDINGGEPSASKNYKTILDNLPKNLKTLRVNTNCSLLIPQLKTIQSRGIQVTVTVSFDGVGLVHDYVRWPIKWDKLLENLLIYKNYGLHSVNLWTTVNALNINDMENIFKFVDKHQFDHSFAMLHSPQSLDISYKNKFTVLANQKFANSKDHRLQNLATILAIGNDNQQAVDNFIHKQDQLRGINIADFINID